MTPPDRLRALLAEPGFVTMPAVWDGLSARLTAAAGFRTAFLSGSCCAADPSRTGSAAKRVTNCSESRREPVVRDPFPTEWALPGL